MAAEVQDICYKDCRGVLYHADSGYAQVLSCMKQGVYARFSFAKKRWSVGMMTAEPKQGVYARFSFAQRYVGMMTAARNMGCMPDSVLQRNRNKGRMPHSVFHQSVGIWPHDDSGTQTRG